jgi:hypothetical protein
MPSAPKAPKQDFNFRFFFTKLEAVGEEASKRASVIALATVFAVGFPISLGIGAGLCLRIATADLSFIQTMVKRFSITSNASLGEVSRD